jgi:hypothetical protein
VILLENPGFSWDFVGWEIVVLGLFDALSRWRVRRWRTREVATERAGLVKMTHRGCSTSAASNRKSTAWCHGKEMRRKDGVENILRPTRHVDLSWALGWAATIGGGAGQKR